MLFLTALTGQQIALWCVGAMGVVISTVKLIEWLLKIGGITKSTEQKIEDALRFRFEQIGDIHAILTDKVFQNQQGDRFSDIAEMKSEIERVFRWMRTPPDVVTPAFWCRAEQISEIKRIVEQLSQDEKEQGVQMEMIVKLLQALAGERINENGRKKTH